MGLSIPVVATAVGSSRGRLFPPPLLVLLPIRDSKEPGCGVALPTELGVAERMLRPGDGFCGDACVCAIATADGLPE